MPVAARKAALRMWGYIGGGRTLPLPVFVFVPPAPLEIEAGSIAGAASLSSWRVR